MYELSIKMLLQTSHKILQQAPLQMIIEIYLLHVSKNKAIPVLPSTENPKLRMDNGH